MSTDKTLLLDSATSFSPPTQSQPVLPAHQAPRKPEENDQHPAGSPPSPCRARSPARRHHVHQHRGGDDDGDGDSVSDEGARVAYTVGEFCRANRFSRGTFYNLLKRGLAPATIRIGSRQYVSVEAARKWREEREANPIPVLTKRKRNWSLP